MASKSEDVLTIRVPREISRKLAREARRRGESRSAVARSILVQGLSDDLKADPDIEARRQSLLVRERESEYEVLQFISQVADLKGWK